jgi:hypothetical protein
LRVGDLAWRECSSRALLAPKRQAPQETRRWVAVDLVWLVAAWYGWSPAPRGGQLSVPPEPVPGSRVYINASRLWAGGVATACVAALVAYVGVLVCRDLLKLSPVRPPLLLDLGWGLSGDYAATAFLCAIAATGLAHLLSLGAPRPRVFFGWIVALATIATMVVPFASSAPLASKVSTAAINLVVGVAIASLLTAVLGRTVVDTEGSWTQRRR